MAPTRAAILGAGAWGTALAVILARTGHQATLWMRRTAQLELLSSQRENKTYLPGILLPAELNLTDKWADALDHAGLVIMAIPSKHARATIRPMAQSIRPGATLVSATKGIEPAELLTMTSMLATLVRPDVHLAALSGPGFAAEVARGKPAALVVAARHGQAAYAVQELFAGCGLRVYRSDDVIGVELAGAAKNVIAIAAGIGDGLELGSSARAAVVTRGLAELMRLGEALGGRRETIVGLAGLGDLVLTCTGDLSRNRTLGMRLAQLGDPRMALAENEGAPVAEGVVNARSVVALAAQAGVEMPIVSAVYRTLYEGKSASAMVEELLSRELKAEF